MWIVSDQAYYEDAETKAHLPTMGWFQTNKYQEIYYFFYVLSFLSSFSHKHTRISIILLMQCSLCSHSYFPH